MTRPKAHDEDTITARPTPALTDWLDHGERHHVPHLHHAFDEDYAPRPARGSPRTSPTSPGASTASRNLRNALAMIDRRMNELVGDDADRYRVELDIVSAELRFDDDAATTASSPCSRCSTSTSSTRSPASATRHRRQQLLVYLRDYDFSVLLAGGQRRGQALHAARGFRHPARQALPALPRFRGVPRALHAVPVVCISVSTSRGVPPHRCRTPYSASSTSRTASASPTSTSARWGCRCGTSCRRAASHRWRSTSAAIFWPTTPIPSWPARWPRWRPSRELPSRDLKQRPRAGGRGLPSHPRARRLHPQRTSRTTAKSAAASASPRVATPRSTS